MSAYYNFWGKAKSSIDDVAQYHLLPYHCLDVAAVGVAYLSQHDALCDYFCAQLRCNKADFLSWAAFWLALHDLGKFSEAFQAQRDDIFECLQFRKSNPERAYTERHDSLGQWYWNDRLFSKCEEQAWFLSNEKAGLDAWMGAVTGHHGQPPKTAMPNSPSDDYFSKGDRKAIDEFVVVIRELFLIGTASAIPSSLLAKDFEKVSSILSWWFAGVTVLADWLGSNTQFFPYYTEIVPLQDYWLIAREQAKQALECSGVLPCLVQKNLVFHDFFPVIENLSPLQRWAASVVITRSPQIFLLEDVTGAGKTEAALILAYRLMEAGNADGFFIGLPTMATSNAMYDRVKILYAKLFAGDANLVLAHGSRNLVEDFARTIMQTAAAEGDDNQEDETATARCTAWLADHNKRALLSQAGIGTIDQVLLGVLHSKHQSLRLLGLFGKVLIIDEVHACDAYMQGILEVLLEFHARAGGCVILLSATLPVHMKQKLLAAYTKGQKFFDPPQIMQQAYPLATWWQTHCPDRIQEEPLQTRAAVTRTVFINYQHERSQVLQDIYTALAAGQCVCWIRNTIADALEAYALLANEVNAENITLFHARFCLHDRLAAEQWVLDKFGKNSTPVKRKGQLVIATQVIEQSLDVDFDLLISDLAPIDRLIQRAGRLRRHIRDAQGNRLTDQAAIDQRGEPCMIVYGPKWDVEPSQSWVKNVLPRAGFVYPDHAQLWLTAKALQQGSFIMPNDARRLIEGVFGEDSIIPVGLQYSNMNAEGKHNADASHAKNNTLKLVAGYKRGDVMDWWSEAKTPSRLGEKSMNVIVARWLDNRLQPWANRQEHAWAYSALRVPERLIASSCPPIEADVLAEYERMLATLPDKGKWSVLLVLKKSPSDLWLGQAWSAENINKPAQRLTWRYDDKAGLQLVEDSQQGDCE